MLGVFEILTRKLVLWRETELGRRTFGLRNTMAAGENGRSIIKALDFSINPTLSERCFALKRDLPGNGSPH
jgi:hypothetical protein